MTVTEKWVARYKDKEGDEGMGISNHHSALGQLVGLILHNGGTNIVITDETNRRGIIDIEKDKR